MGFCRVKMITKKDKMNLLTVELFIYSMHLFLNTFTEEIFELRLKQHSF